MYLVGDKEGNNTAVGSDKVLDSVALFDGVDVKTELDVAEELLGRRRRRRRRRRK